MARKLYPLAPVDRNGRQIRVGDVVRLVQAPRMPTMPAETKSVFRRSRRRLFRIACFERNGLAELYVQRFETIYVEPGCLSLQRRGARRRAHRFRWGNRAI